MISASRRCDLPAFACDWFLQQLQQGYCLVVNPFNPKQVSRVSLAHDNVEAFIFWTRNPQPFAPAIERLQQLNFAFGFMFTITGYNKELEPFCPEPAAAISTIKQLSQKIGREKLIWRYDPIIISDHLTFKWHLENFSGLAAEISPYVSGCIISLLDYYRKTERNLKSLRHNFLREPELNRDFSGFLAHLRQIAQQHNLNLSCCCETDPAFAAAGIVNSGCINSAWLEKLTGHPFTAGKHKGQRKNCNCCYSKDIGTYNTCRHGCRYCYAC